MERGLFLCLAVFTVLCASVVVAQNEDAVVATGMEVRDSVGAFACNVFCAAALFIAGLAALVVILGGLKYLASGDDPAARDGAKKMIVYAFVGLAFFIVIIPVINIATDYLSTYMTPFDCNCETLEFETVPPTTLPPKALAALIVTPKDGSEHEVGEEIKFVGKAVGGSPNYTFQWRSDIDGNLGSLDIFTKTLTRENHTITLRVTDSNSSNASDEVRINVVVPKPKPVS